MATTPKNRITRSVSNGKSIFPDASAVHSSSTSYNQGDLLIFDDSANVVKVAAAESDGATFLGIAIQTVVNGKLKYPYSTDVDDSQGLSVLVGPQYDVVAKLILKTGDSVAPGDLMYLDPADSAQHVTVSGTKAIGVYQGPTISSAASGTQVEVLLGTRFPGDALKF